MSENNLTKLREPFPAHQIGKLPKPTKQQTEEVRRDFKAGTRCEVCGGWHHPKVIHLDYVGHAALTDRFLDCDKTWNWEPFSLDENGLPAFDRNGLLWIRLTICGVTRIGVGDAGQKTGGDAIKECVGDALRNAGMRFGAALDLWHKGDLHTNEATEIDAEKAEKILNRFIELIGDDDADELKKAWHEMDRHYQIHIWSLLSNIYKDTAKNLLNQDKNNE